MDGTSPDVSSYGLETTNLRLTFPCHFIEEERADVRYG
jgi:hypothetical protein